MTYQMWESKVHVIGDQTAVCTAAGHQSEQHDNKSTVLGACMDSGYFMYAHVTRGFHDSRFLRNEFCTLNFDERVGSDLLELHLRASDGGSYQVSQITGSKRGTQTLQGFDLLDGAYMVEI